MTPLGQCLQDLADSCNTHSNSIANLCNASEHNSDSIKKLADCIKDLKEQVEKLEARIKELETPGSAGSGNGHYGGGPWGG